MKLNNALLGLRVLVKTTDDREKLQGIVDTTLSMLDSTNDKIT
jgi:TetR/AcrR family transcriptional regulator, transcriptional repressor for nem operon